MAFGCPQSSSVWLLVCPRGVCLQDWVQPSRPEYHLVDVKSVRAGIILYIIVVLFVITRDAFSW